MSTFFGVPVDAAYHVVSLFAGAFAPLFGGLAAAAAIVAFTMAVRLLLLPLSYRAIRGLESQARLAPLVAALRKKHAGQPDRLQRELAALYRAEGTSMFAGFGPLLLQWPFLSVMYLLFRSPTVGGGVNTLLRHDLLGAPLGSHWLGGAGPLSAQGAVFAGLFALLVLLGWLSYRVAKRGLARSAAPATPTSPATPSSPATNLLARLTPYITVVIAAFLPLAAGLYLVTTTAWTLAERTLLRRRLGRSGNPFAAGPPPRLPSRVAQVRQDGRTVSGNTRGLTGRFPVLALRDFRLLLADRLLAPAAFGFSMVGVAFAVLDTTHSTADLSYVLAAQIAPSLVFSLIGGVFADRMPPQRVIIAGNLMIALGEGLFGLLVLTGNPLLWQMIALECVTGTGMALFYPASQALLPRLVPGHLLTEASALSRLAMNGGQMGGAAIAGLVVAATGPGWALAVCGLGMLGTVPVLLGLRVAPGEPSGRPGLLRELHDGWAEFRSRTWLWVTVAEYATVMMAWYGAFQVLGPAVARAHLGGPAAWGAITASESVGLIVGGLVALRFQPRRPMLFVVLIGALIAIPTLSLAALWPLPLICLCAFGVGIAIEVMMVIWTVTMATNIPPGKLARVSSYDMLGTIIAMPAGALAAGPVAAVIGVSTTQYAAVALILVASALALIPREIRSIRRPQTPDTAAVEAGTVRDQPFQRGSADLPM